MHQQIDFIHSVRYYWLRWLLTSACVWLMSEFVSAQYRQLSILDDARKDTITLRFATSEEVIHAAHSYYHSVLDEGYLKAVADTSSADTSLFLNVHRNDLFTLRDLYTVAGGTGVQTHTRIQESLSKNARNEAFKRRLEALENEGYPFASLTVDSVAPVSAGKRGTAQRVDVFATVRPGPLVLNDSLHIRSASALPYNYIRNYIDFKKNDLYDESRIAQTGRRLREIPFVLVKRPSEVRFEPGNADLYLFVERKKANYFNAIAGLRPDETTGKVNITGDAEVRFMNGLNRGEELAFVWRKLQPLTQDLSLKAMVPYLFNTPVAIDGRMQIYKRDTSFTSVKLMGGAGILLPRNQRLRVFAERNRSDQLTGFYTAAALANAQHTLYGLSTQLEDLDYRWNPLKGYSLQTEAATGYRVTSTSTAEGVEATRRPLTRIDASMEYYVPVFKRQTILFSLKGAALFSDSLYENEVMRIGGLRTIRGINEESIFATAWGVSTIEYRLLPEENSAVYLFVDMAWYEYDGSRGYIRDTPLSAGAGFNFETKAGIFTFNYALGKQFDNPVLLRNGKISFGFRSLF
jgi:outer membrane protein assembly factor BamA